MQTRYIAYFVGGPEDLTKRVLFEPYPVLQFAEMPDLGKFPLDVNEDEPIKDLKYRVHTYEQMHHHRCPAENADVFIYVHQGVR